LLLLSASLTKDPLSVLRSGPFTLVKGRVPWPVQSTVAAALMAGVLLVLAIVVLVAWRKGASKRARGLL
jgi:hypothetical protein